VLVTVVTAVGDGAIEVGVVPAVARRVVVVTCGGSVLTGAAVAGATVDGGRVGSTTVDDTTTSDEPGWPGDTARETDDGDEAS
jgi:hypothetical protein